MENFLGKKITEATFSSPIRLIGFSELPKVGEVFKTFDTKEEALQAAAAHQEKKVKVCQPETSSEEDAENKIGVINVVIKADVIGSIEGIEHELNKVKNERMKIKVVHSGVGEIGENDINTLAGKPDSIVLGFNVKTDSKARAAAERTGITIQTFDIIYKLAEWLTEFALARTPKIQVEEMSAKIKVLKLFSQTKDKYVLGGRVEEGELKIGDDIKIMRRDLEVGRGKIRELQQAKEKTSEVRSGVEFGCMLQSSIAPAPGDKLEAYQIVTK
jgi:translation initiation factor IF-2